MSEPAVAAPALRHLCSVDLTVHTPMKIGEGPSGNRLVAEIATMSLSGERLNAELVGSAAADWLAIANNVATIHVRATLKTDDGALIYLLYTGRTDVTNGLGSSPVVVAPVFETSDERYLWLNSVQAIGKGDVGKLRYEWFEVL